MKLGELCLLFTDGDWIESKDQSDSGIRLIQTGNIGNGEFLYKNDKAKYISEDTFKRLNCTEVFPDDILISRLPEPVGRGCIIPDIGERMITAVDCTICRVNEKLIDRKYFCYFLESNTYKTQLEQHVTGTTRKRISRKNLSGVEIDIPEQAKQKEIVYKLDRVKKIIRNYNGELDLLDEAVRARFVEMFGNPVNNPYNFSKMKLGKICDVRDGTHDSPKYQTVGYPLITSKNLTSGEIDFSNCNYIKEEDYKKINLRSEVTRGDIIMPMIGTIGNPIIVNTDIRFAIKNVALIKFNNNTLQNIYVKYFLGSDYFDFSVLRNIRGGTQKFIALKDLRDLDILVPPLELQNQFASFVEEIDKSRLLSNHSLFLIKSIIF